MPIVLTFLCLNKLSYFLDEMGTIISTIILKVSRVEKHLQFFILDAITMMIYWLEILWLGLLKVNPKGLPTISPGPKLGFSLIY